ncbi:MAG TPA: type II toxin-antitoxin system death-on-curing family toxin [Candidatus Saccharimonadales bacterium]|nr:type II toxin-antitoxin system death-on-curing family toxin [Candidatus Saccharimonadales bacterium]
MNYLTASQLLLVHSIIIDETGGGHGVRDNHALLTLEQLPKQTAFGEELYPTVFTKAALYIRNIIMAHPFVDGNKRTGMGAGIIFLENNGYLITAKEGEIESFAVRVVTEKLDLVTITAWLKAHTRKLKQA